MLTLNGNKIIFFHFVHLKRNCCTKTMQSLIKVIIKMLQFFTIYNINQNFIAKTKSRSDFFVCKYNYIKELIQAGEMCCHLGAMKTESSWHQICHRWQHQSKSVLVEFITVNRLNKGNITPSHRYRILAEKDRTRGCHTDNLHWHQWSGMTLGLRPANERRRYFVTTSLIGWAKALSDYKVCNMTTRNYQWILSNDEVNSRNRLFLCELMTRD